MNKSQQELLQGKCTPAAKVNNRFIEPAFVWGRNNIGKGIFGYSIAPSGLAIYHGAYTLDSSGEKKYGEMKYPNWKGNIFVGAMTRSANNKNEKEFDKIGAIRRLRECGGRFEERQIIQIQRKPGKSQDRIRDIRVGPDGYIYALRHGYHDANADGQLIRLLPITAR